MTRIGSPGPATTAAADRDRALAWSGSETAARLLDAGQRLGGTALLEAVCAALLADGVPLQRAACGLPAMDPQVFARNLVWSRGKGASEGSRAHGITDTAVYRDSPVALIHQGVAGIRRRLELAETPMDFPILHELKALGATDYVAMPLRFTTGQVNHISWATDRAGGFSTEHLALLWDLLPLLALRLEVEAAHRGTATMLGTYLGERSAGQVLAGTLRRGQGTRIRAALWYSDLRGFTQMIDRQPAERVIAVLDEYFDIMARAVREHGGEVLKFIGDGMLAMFEIADQDRSDPACRALNAAKAALQGLEALNRERLEAGAQPLRAGIGLHLGDAVFGNVGASDRLDFTVIGVAVNQVCRVEALCRRLDRPLLATAAFQAAACDPRLRSVGFHPLRGMREPEELFALAPGEAPDQVMTA